MAIRYGDQRGDLQTTDNNTLLQEEVMKVQSNLQLDLNLEKGRIKEEASCMLPY